MDTMSDIGGQTRQAVEQLIAAAALQPGQILVVGCSTSEVAGVRIGTGGSKEIAGSIFAGLFDICAKYQLFLAIQCCEHLNRALVVERRAMERFGLDEVSVVPVPQAGGSLAAQAMKMFEDAVVVEAITAHAGLDIGNTLIGMHLKRVAVPVRLDSKTIGQAALVAAVTRPKLIGGVRAVYQLVEG